MIRVRFKTNALDYRPVNWPIKHPYWCTGFGDDYAILVSYADDVDYIRENWPEACELDVEHRNEYTFTDRFPKPEWFEEPIVVSVLDTPDTVAWFGKDESANL